MERGATPYSIETRIPVARILFIVPSLATGPDSHRPGDALSATRLQDIPAGRRQHTNDLLVRNRIPFVGPPPPAGGVPNLPSGPVIGEHVQRAQRVVERARVRVAVRLRRRAHSRCVVAPAERPEDGHMRSLRLSRPSYSRPLHRRHSGMKRRLRTRMVCDLPESLPRELVSDEGHDEAVDRHAEPKLPLSQHCDPKSRSRAIRSYRCQKSNDNPVGESAVLQAVSGLLFHVSPFFRGSRTASFLTIAACTRSIG